MPLKMTNDSEVSPELVRRVLHYSALTGVFTWRERSPDYCSCVQGWRMFNRRYSGAEAGCLMPSGYVGIRINGRRHMAHRLAFLYMSGSHPEDEVDHINGQRADNRFANLRCVTSAENMKNLSRRQNNSSGCTGVSWDARAGKWLSRVSTDGRRVFLGHYEDWFDAVCAVRSGVNVYGYHPNHGKAA